MGYNLKTVREKFRENGIFYTDRKLADYMRSFLPKEVDEVYDPTCGHGGLLKIFADDVRKYGQDNNPEAVEAARKIPNSEISCGDTLTKPAFMGKKFSAILANPPYSLKWEPNLLTNDVRFQDVPCLPTRSRADFAFLLHILYYLADDGVAAVMSAAGVGYRGQREAKLRKWFIENNYIETVVAIPGGQFVDTSIPTLLLILRKNKDSTDIHFLNKEEDLEHIATLDEVRQNDFCLTPGLYAYKEEQRLEIDPVAVEQEARRRMCNALRFSLETSCLIQDHLDGDNIAGYLDALQEVINEYRAGS